MSVIKSLLAYAGLMVLSTSVSAQITAKDFESRCSDMIASLPQKEGRYFDSIISIRTQTGIDSRIDSLRYDYLFIQEEFCVTGNRHQTTEYYFISGDTLPTFVYTNGIYQNPRDLFGENPLDPHQESRRFHLFSIMYPHFSQTKAFQELSYNPEIYVARRFAETDEDLNRILSQSADLLRQTYQIMTLVDIKGNGLHISVQKPALNPELKAIYYDDIWGW